MRLYILRHANADTAADTDNLRELSEKGTAQADLLAKFFVKHEVQLDFIFSSPLVRARQTASPIAEALRMQTTEVHWLSCGARPDKILLEMRALTAESVLLVGHQPDMGEFIAHLLGSPIGENFNVRKGLLTCIDLYVAKKGGGRLDFFLPAKLI